VVALRGTVEAHKWQLEQIQEALQQIEKRLEQEQNERQKEIRELHQHLSAVSRELETVVGSLTDNQEVIKGIQAFVRFITQAAARA
jgi:chromosome segregation ATPase